MDLHQDQHATYRVAGATTQDDYEHLRHELIDAFTELDRRLADRRYLFGTRITESDVRLWPTLVRFDLGYNPLAKISERPLTEFEHLWGYARDLYQFPAFRESTDFDAIAGFTRGPTPSFLAGGPRRIEVEPRLADWSAPPGRFAESFAG